MEDWTPADNWVSWLLCCPSHWSPPPHLEPPDDFFSNSRTVSPLALWLSHSVCQTKPSFCSAPATGALLPLPTPACHLSHSAALTVHSTTSPWLQSLHSPWTTAQKTGPQIRWKGAKATGVLLCELIWFCNLIFFLDISLMSFVNLGIALIRCLKDLIFKHHGSLFE